MREWKQVTRRHRCPVCDSPHWCALHIDGDAVRCQFVHSGDTVQHTGSDEMGDYAIHLLRGGGGTGPKVKRTRAPEPAVADSETLDKVYATLLAELGLSAGHREGLRERGLSDERIDACRFATMPHPSRRDAVLGKMRATFTASVLATVPGFARGAAGWLLLGATGLLVPVRTSTGRIVALKIRADKGESKYVWLSSTSADGPSPGCPPHFVGTGDTWLLTEGPLKAEVIAALQPLPVCGVAGVNASMDATARLRELAKVVRLAFDADHATNDRVAVALERTALRLADAGLTVELARWDGSLGKGLDDVLHAGHGDQVEVLTGEGVWGYLCETIEAHGLEPQAETRARAARAEPVSEDPLADLLSRVRRDVGAAFEAAVLDAVVRLSARDFQSLRHDLGAAGVQLRAWDNAVRDARSAVREEEPESEDRHERKVGVYSMTRGAITTTRMSPDGSPRKEPVAAFSALITAELIECDGQEEQRVLEIEAVSSSGLVRTVRVPSGDFAGMRWVDTQLGPSFVIAAGAASRDHCRAAIQTLSQPIETKRLYTFTGWHKHEGEWVYLHAGGAIGADGVMRSVATRVEEPASLFAFDEVGDVDDLRLAFDLFTCGPARVVVPVLCAAWRAVLGWTPAAVYLAGQGESGKSTIAGLAAAHFGRAQNSKRLPVSLKGGVTAGAIPRARSMVGDALFVLDDFMLTGDQRSDAGMTELLESAVRAQYARSGRRRLERNGLRLQSEQAPRCLSLYTGEVPPTGHSLTSRLICCAVERRAFGDLSPWLEMAARGVFARAMAAHIQWLAPRLDQVRADLAKRVREEQQLLGRMASERTSEMACDLIAGLRVFLRHAFEAGAIDRHEGETLLTKARCAFVEVAEEQARSVRVRSIAYVFVNAIRDGLRSGAFHLRNTRGDAAPTPYGSWGWFADGVGAGLEASVRPKGECIGYLQEGKHVLLLRDAALRGAKRVANASGQSLTCTSDVLTDRLAEAGLLDADEMESRQTRTVRRRVQGLLVHGLLSLSTELFNLTEQDTPTVSEATDTGTSTDTTFS